LNQSSNERDIPQLSLRRLKIDEFADTAALAAVNTSPKACYEAFCLKGKQV
jgi:hypothetical protein